MSITEQDRIDLKSHIVKTSEEALQKANNSAEVEKIRVVSNFCLRDLDRLKVER